MSEQIDWSKAPVDATHHKAEDSSVFELWLKPGYAVRVSRGSSDWVRSSEANRLIAECGATARPSTPSWSGEGLPPVGVVCEYNPMPVGKPKKWHKVEVVYASEWVIVMRCIEAPSGHEGGNGVEIAMAVDSCSLEDIRPIRTPEQIAEDERESALIELIKDAGKSLATGSLEQAAKIYDAGWRKHPKP